MGLRFIMDLHRASSDTGESSRQAWAVVIERTNNQMKVNMRDTWAIISRIHGVSTVLYYGIPRSVTHDTWRA